MAWGTTGTGLSFLPKLLGPLGGAATLWGLKDWAGGIAKQNPGLIGINPLATLGAVAQGAKEGGFESGIKGIGERYRYMTDEEMPGLRGVGHFNKSMEESVKKATTDSEEEDPFNYNQLFIASILKGLKQDPPSQSGGRAAGTYIPRPDLPMMSDYDSNKTYWNIG